MGTKGFIKATGEWVDVWDHLTYLRENHAPELYEIGLTATGDLEDIVIFLDYYGWVRVRSFEENHISYHVSAKFPESIKLAENHFQDNPRGHMELCISERLKDTIVKNNF